MLGRKQMMELFIKFKWKVSLSVKKIKILHFSLKKKKKCSYVKFA